MSLRVQLMSDAIHGDGEKPRITEDDFIEALGGGISFIGRLNVRSKQDTQFGHAAEKADGGLLAALFAVCADLIVPDAVMPYGEHNLFGEGFKKSGQLLTEIVSHVDLIHTCADKITGIENAARHVYGVDDGLPRRNGFRPHVVKAIVAGAGRCKLFNNGRYFVAKFPGYPNIRFALIHLGLVIVHGDFSSFTGQSIPGRLHSSMATCCATFRLWEAAFL